MNASERFRKYLAGEPVDRCPCIEWAPWWNLTVDRWRADGLPEDVNTIEKIQDYFGLDKCLQFNASYRTAETPAPAGHGLGIMENEEDWERIKKTLFPPRGDRDLRRHDRLRKACSRSRRLDLLLHRRRLFLVSPHAFRH